MKKIAFYSTLLGLLLSFGSSNLLAQPSDDDLGLDDNLTMEQNDEGPHAGPPPDDGARPGPHGRSGGPAGERIAQKLGLTEQQRDQISEIRGSRTEREKSRLQERLAHIELKEAIENGKVGDDEIMKKVRELNSMMAKRNEERVKNLLAVRKILTPEQREKIKKFREEHPGKMRERFGAGQGRRMGGGPRGERGEFNRGASGPGQNGER